MGVTCSEDSSDSGNSSLKPNHSYNNLIISDFQLPSSVLIFENRPSNLPAKSQQEALKHKQEYEKMVEIAKKKGTLVLRFVLHFYTFLLL
jgi:hypothetical protein